MSDIERLRDVLQAIQSHAGRTESLIYLERGEKIPSSDFVARCARDTEEAMRLVCSVKGRLLGLRA